MLAGAQIPPRYRTCDLESFVTYKNDQLLRAVDRARRFIDVFPVVDKGLLLIGPPGIGKTHIAIAVLRQVVFEKGAPEQAIAKRESASADEARDLKNPLTFDDRYFVLRMG